MSEKIRLCQLTLLIFVLSCLHRTIWWCMPWFGSTWSNAEWSALAWSSSVLHMRIWDDLIYLAETLREKTSSCICINIVIPDILKDHSLQLHGKAVQEVTPNCLTLKALQSFKTQGTTYPTKKTGHPKSLVEIFLVMAVRTLISCSTATHFNIHLLFHCRSSFIKILNWYVQERGQRPEYATMLCYMYIA
jgi:hypothetical protein